MKLRNRILGDKIKKYSEESGLSEDTIIKTIIQLSRKYKYTDEVSFLVIKNQLAKSAEEKGVTVKELVKRLDEIGIR